MSSQIIKLLNISTLSATLMASCGIMDPLMKRTGATPDHRTTKQVKHLALIESYGGFSVPLSNDKEFDQQTHLNQENLPINSSITIPAQGLTRSANLTISEGQGLDLVLLRNRLHLPTMLVPLGVPILFNLDKSAQLKKEAWISIPLTDVMKGTLNRYNSSKDLVVSYRAKNDDGVIVEGIIPNEKLSLSTANSVQFATSKLGVFQLAYTKSFLALGENTDAIILELPAVEDVIPALGHPSNMIVSGITPVVAQPGDVVSVSGYNFRSVKIFVDHMQVENVQVKSTELLTFQVPAKTSFGIKQFYFRQDGMTVWQMMVLKSKDMGNVVLATNSDSVCSTDTYFELSTELTPFSAGKRECIPSTHLPQCSRDGEINCVTSSTFKAADMIAVSNANIKQGVSIAGVNGTYGGGGLADCSQDGEIGCKTVNQYRSISVSQVSASDIRSGTTIAGVTGTAVIESHGACNSDGATGCVTNSSYKSANIAAIAASDIVQGKTIAGVSGTATVESHNTCGTDGSISCVVDGINYVAASKSTAIPANIKVGIILAGITGTAPIKPADCSQDGVAGCVTTNTFKSADMSIATAAQIKSGVTIAGVLGTATLENHNNCTGDAEIGCITTNSFKAANISAISAADLKTGKTIAGIAGSATIESHSSCANDGASSCVVDGTNYVAASKSTAIPANIKNGITLAGVTGSAPTRPSDCLADGDTGCVVLGPLYAAVSIVGIDSKILSGQSIAGVSGNVTLPPATAVRASNGTYGVAGTSITPTLANCAGDGLTSCVTVSGYKSADMTKAVATNIITDVTIAGITGTAGVTNSGACAGDGSVGCVTTSRYKSADTSLYSSTEVKTGYTIGGISGSITNCSLDGQQSCYVESPSLFKAANISGLSGSQIATGYQVGGIVGTKLDIRNCRSQVNTSYDNTSSPAVSGLDIFDTIDDYNNGATASPTLNPWGQATYACNADNFTISSGPQYYATDSLSGMMVTSVNPQGSMKAWTAAYTACQALSWGGFAAGSWRLPTQKEMMQLYVDGMSRVDASKMGNLAQYLWTSTTVSDFTANAWVFDLSKGNLSGLSSKALTSLSIVCVK